MNPDLLYSDEEDDDSMSLPPLPSSPTTPHRATPPLPDTPLPRVTDNSSPLQKLDSTTQIKTEQIEEEDCGESVDYKTETDARYRVKNAIR